MIRKTLLAAVFATSLGAVAVPAAAAIIVQIAPPPPRVEVVPAPRRGHTWAPGYWNWNGKKHVWSAGHWERDRHGYHYNESRWVERDGSWHLERGRWARGDNDHDGVPNGADHQPNNPNRS